MTNEENQHQGFPVLNPAGYLVGVLTRRDLLDPRISGSRELREILFRPPKFVYDDCTARQAAHHMVNHNIGRLPVVLRSKPTQLIGIVTRSDILSAYRRQIEDNEAQRPDIHIPRLSRRVRSLSAGCFVSAASARVTRRELRFHRRFVPRNRDTWMERALLAALTSSIRRIWSHIRRDGATIGKGASAGGRWECLPILPGGPGGSGRGTSRRCRALRRRGPMCSTCGRRNRRRAGKR